MVLEEAIRGDRDSYSSTSSDSTESNGDRFDPSSSTSLNSTGYSIDASRLPGPVPIFGPLLGYGQAATIRRASALASQSSNLLNRPFTQDEIQAFAEHSAMMMRITSVGGTLGAFGGAYRAYQTRESFKFPFMKVREPGAIDMNKFGPLRGDIARMARGGLRVSSYVAFGVFLGDLLMTGYATANLASSLQKDERLSEWMEVIKNAAKSRSRGRGLEKVAVDDVQEDHQQEESYRQSSQQQHQQRRGGFFGGRSGADDDDMSPKAAGFDEAAMLTDDQLRVRDQAQARAQQQSDRQTDRQNEARAAARNAPRAQQDNDPFSTEGRPAQSQSSGSAWDRLRQTATSGQTQTSSTRASSPNDQNREWRGQSSRGDSFSFSSTDEERQLAKAEAQKEFDARVERERRGGDFEDRGKRW